MQLPDTLNTEKKDPAAPFDRDSQPSKIENWYTRRKIENITVTESAVRLRERTHSATMFVYTEESDCFSSNQIGSKM